MPKLYKILIVLAVVAIVGWLLVGSSPSSNPEGSTSVYPVPISNLETLSGEVINEDDLNRVVVVNSWATWCPFCVEELPDFSAVQAQLHDDVSIIAVNRRESAEDINNFLAELPTNVDNLIFALDPGDKIYRDIGGFAMPETVVMTQSGGILEHHRGPLTEEQLFDLLEPHI